MLFNKKKTYEQHDNEKESYYRHSIKPYSSEDFLEDYLEVDICIIGGGLTGVSSALNLVNKGYSVALCESRLIGWGASGRIGGQLGNFLNLKILSSKILTLITSALVLFVSVRIGYRIFF